MALIYLFYYLSLDSDQNDQGSFCLAILSKNKKSVPTTCGTLLRSIIQRLASEKFN